MLNDNKIIDHNQHRRREVSTSNYHVYMIRMWKDSEPEQDTLRLSAEDTRTGERIGFTSWDKLIQHLQKQIEEPIINQ